MIRALPVAVSGRLRSGVAITNITQCVEELVLNSLDAGSTCVAVRLDLSCFKIQVVDNGSGIEHDQLDFIASRHHTSKCKELEDLDNLEYFGFRGEALASIVEISAIVDIVSRVKHCSKTYYKLFTNGKANSSKECQTARPSAGTTVTVHDLFKKLPVRKNTTNPALELERVKQRLEAIALIHPGVSISLRNDENNANILQSRKCNSTIGVFRHFYGHIKAACSLKEVTAEKGLIKISGFIGSEAHSNKNLQFVYINNRLVLKTKIQKFTNNLLRKLFSSRKKISEKLVPVAGSPCMANSPTKQTEKHGIFVFNIICPLNEYDITFDPSKTLVEFKDWETVLSAVEEIFQNFQNLLSPVPGLDLHKTNAPEKQEISSLLSLPPEISTCDTTKSLHSKLVTRARTSVCGELLISDDNHGQADCSGGSAQEVTINEPSENTVKPLTSSESEHTDGDISPQGNKLEEDPLCLYSDTTKTSKDVNDSGIDLDMEFLPGTTLEQFVHQKPKWKNSQVEGKIPSRLSALKSMVNSCINVNENSSAKVKSKITNLKESLKQTEGSNGSPHISALSSLQKLREEVLKKNKQEIKSQSVNALSSKTTWNCTSSSDKKPPGVDKQTSSAKLARLAGLGVNNSTIGLKLNTGISNNWTTQESVQEADNQYDNLQKLEKVSTSTNCGEKKYIKPSSDQVIPGHQKLTSSLPKISEQNEELPMVVDRSCRGFSNKESDPKQREQNLDQQNHLISRKFLTSENIINPRLPSPQDLQVDPSLPVIPLGFVEKHQHLQTLTTLDSSDVSIKAMGTHTNQGNGVKKVESKDQFDLKCKSSVFQDMALQQPVEFRSPKGHIRLSPGSQTSLQPTELFQGYHDVDKDGMRNSMCSEQGLNSNPNKEDCDIPALSQGFDFKTFKPISCSPIESTLSIQSKEKSSNALKYDGLKEDNHSQGFDSHGFHFARPDCTKIDHSDDDLEKIKDTSMNEVKCFEPSQETSQENSSIEIIPILWDEKSSKEKHPINSDEKTQLSFSVTSSSPTGDIQSTDISQSGTNLKTIPPTVSQEKDLVDLLITQSPQSGLPYTPIPNQPTFFENSLSSSVYVMKDYMPQNSDSNEYGNSRHGVQSIDSSNLLKVTNLDTQTDKGNSSSILSPWSETSEFRKVENVTTCNTEGHDLLTVDVQTSVPKQFTKATVSRENILNIGSQVEELEKKIVPSKRSLCEGNQLLEVQPKMDNLGDTNSSKAWKGNILNLKANTHDADCEIEPMSIDLFSNDSIKSSESQSGELLDSSPSYTCMEPKRQRRINVSSTVTQQSTLSSINNNGDCLIDSEDQSSRIPLNMIDTLESSSDGSTVCEKSFSNESLSLAETVSESLDTPNQISCPNNDTSALSVSCDNGSVKMESSSNELSLLKRNHPQSGKRIFIHPVTGHSMDEASWEIWRKENVTGDKDQDSVGKGSAMLTQRKRLLPHDLANLLRKKPCSEMDISAIASRSVTHMTDQGEISTLWSDHVTCQSEIDNIKWRNPSDSEKMKPASSDSMTDLFEEWDNPVFSLPEQEVKTVELPSRQTTAIKVKKAVQPCRFNKNMLTDAQVLGQVDDKFIACLMRSSEKNLSSEKDLLVLVDQHAAHERVRLEQLTEDSFVCDDHEELKVLKRSDVKPPLELNISEEIIRVMKAYTDKFLMMGVEFSLCDKRDHILLKSAPCCLMEREANEIKKGRNSVIVELMKAFIKEQVELLQSTHGALPSVPPTVHRLLCSRACHGAIKFGDSLSCEDCQEVVQALSHCNLPFQCAHGRPSVMPVLNLDEFKTKFPAQIPKKPQLWKLRQALEDRGMV